MDSSILSIIVYSLIAGITIFIGGLSARMFEKNFTKVIESYFLNWIVAFGGGILVAAVAFVLVPHGVEIFPILYFTPIFLSGALIFFLIDKTIEKKGGLFAQTMAMLLDFIPESIALGAVFIHNRGMGILLAFFIGIQNLPESFNAYFDLRKSGHRPKSILSLFFGLSFLGVFGALMGYYLLKDQPVFTASIMLFSGGGILYLIFQDIAPLSKVKNHWEPALGAVMGFILGMIGTKIF